MNGSEPEPSRLARRLGLGDAVVVGLGSMLGAGIFAAIGPAAGAAGTGLLVGLGVAAVVAYCNATSSAALAAEHPESGGTYVYGRERLGPAWGFLAGWGFVVGKTASCAAMALTFAAYAGDGEAVRPLAVGVTVVLGLVNWFGVHKTALATRVIVTLVLVALTLVVVACLGGGTAELDRLGPLDAGGVHGTLQAAALLFFAFAGYARIATLGEEVVDPSRTIPRAIPLALGIALVVYAVVATAALLAVGPITLATSDTPLTAAVAAGSLDGLVPVVRIGAAIASAGVLLSLLAGVSRTVFSMAANADLPPALGAVHARHRTPHRAELAVVLAVVAVVLVADVRDAIGFSAFTVLAYYAIANAAAWTLPRGRRPWWRGLPVLGIVGCVVLGVSLSWSSILAGLAVLAVGACVHVGLVLARGRRA